MRKVKLSVLSFFNTFNNFFIALKLLCVALILKPVVAL